MRPGGQVRADSVILLEINNKNSRAHTVVAVLDEQQHIRAGIGERQDGRPRPDLYDAEGETWALLRLDDGARPKFELDP